MLRLLRVNLPVKQAKTFELDTFSFHPIEFDYTKSNILVGAPGCGKTSYVRSLFPEALFVSHMDQLSGFDSDVHTAIIFDDMSFSHMPRTAQIHILDIEQDRAIHIRYSIAEIPAGVKKFFTSNTEDLFDFCDGAISRRCAIHRI